MIMPIFSVSNVDESVTFYTEKLGFTNDGVLSGADGKGEMGFLSLEDNRLGLGKAPFDGKPGNGIDMMIYVDRDIDAYYGEITGRDVTPESELKTEYWGDRMFSIKDPDGYVLTFAKTVKRVPMDEIEAHMRGEG